MCSKFPFPFFGIDGLVPKIKNILNMILFFRRVGHDESIIHMLAIAFRKESARKVRIEKAQMLCAQKLKAFMQNREMSFISCHNRLQHSLINTNFVFVCALNIRYRRFYFIYLFMPVFNLQLAQYCYKCQFTQF